jgi:hypothetical protein
MQVDMRAITETFRTDAGLTAFTVHRFGTSISNMIRLER